MSSPAVATVNADLRTTPYEKPKDVVVWNRETKSWIRIDLQGESAPTIGWLRRAILKKIGEKETAYVCMKLSSGLELKRNDELLEYHTFDDCLSFRCFSTGFSGESFEIYVKTLTGRTMTLHVNSFNSVEEVKQKIQDNDGTPPEQQRLICESHQLEDDEMLGELNIQQGAIIRLVLRLRGGGGAPTAFVDLSNEAGLQHIAFSKKAPEWRVAMSGLNLEGKCTNRQCEAFGHQVIMPMGGGVFDLMLDCNADTCKCPQCKQFVKPTTCAFMDCKWKWTGLKVPFTSQQFRVFLDVCCLLDLAPTSNTPAQRVEKVEFAIAGHEYVRFNDAPISEGGSGSVQWLRLKIQTIDMWSVRVGLSRDHPQKCFLCMKSDGYGKPPQEWTQSACCTHKFHSSCIDKFKASTQSNGVEMECPMDRLKISE